MPLRPGDTFERYRVESLLGEGGMGAVYRAFDTNLQRTVALKVLQAGGDGSIGTARILREARAAAALAHPNALVTHDVGEHEGIAYIAMEYVEGRPLRAFVGDESIELATKVRWLREIASVLAAAHDAGIVHRDVKPENVMIRKDGVVKVLDFGIARRPKTPVDPSAPTAQSGGDGLATITGEGIVVGTPLYMAPEQIRSGPLDGRTDQFAWGVVAYELLSGRVPWTAQDAPGLVAAIIADAPPPLASVATGVSEAVCATVMRALAKDPSRRFDSMHDVVAALAPGAANASKEGRATATRRALAIASLVAAVGVGLAANAYRASAPAANAAPTPSASASASSGRIGVGLADRPRPNGCSDEAARLYREGLMDLRDRGWETAQRSFDDAGKVDPTCAAVQLRRAWIRMDSSNDFDTARDAYQRAIRRRDTLDERDRDCLEALGALFGPTTPSRLELSQAFQKLAQSYPNDAEILQMAAYLGPRKESEPLLRRAIAIDPKSSDAWQSLAMLRAAQNDLDGALGFAEQCLANAPASVDCEQEAFTLAASAGACAKAEKFARAQIAADPEGAAGYRFLAQALAAAGAPKASIEEALVQSHARSRGGNKAVYDAIELAEAAILDGDFASAAAHAADAERAAKSAGELSVHASSAVLSVRLADEQGDRDAAAKLAADFVRRAGVWSPPVANDFHALHAVDAIPFLADVAVRGKKLPADERERVVSRWETSVAHELTSPAVLWLLGHGLPATSREDATKALADAPPDASDALLHTRSALSASFAGMRGAYARLLRTAGRLDEALAAYGLATADCAPLIDAVAFVRAHAERADALEEKGDVAAACEEDAFVLAHWGKAPKSVTADHARERFRALKCPP